MKIYTQCILWSYILLPTICILLSPALILGIAKAQQQRGKIMANAINARAKVAAAFARNQARNYQKRLVPNSRFSSGIGQNYFKSRTPRDTDTPMDISDVGGDAFERKTHWDQQEESMGQLQNMWNMNNFGNMPSDGFLRDAHIKEDSATILPFAKSADPEPTLELLKKLKRKKEMQNNPSSYHQPSYYNSYYAPYYARSDNGERQPELIEQEQVSRERNQILGSPRIYVNTKPDAGAFFGRNVYDDIVGAGNPATVDVEENDTIVPFAKSAQPEPTLELLKKLKRKKEMQNSPSSYYPPSYYNSYYAPYYARSNNGEPRPELIEQEQVSSDMTLPFAKSAHPEPTLELLKKLKRKKEMEHNPSFYYPPNYNSFYYTPYSARSDTEGSQPGIVEQQTSSVLGEKPHMMPLFQKSANPEPTFKKQKNKGHNIGPFSYCSQSYHPGPYYGRSAELFEFEPIQVPELFEEQLNSEQPPDFSKRTSGHHHHHMKGKKNKGKTDYSYYSSSYHGRNHENHDMVGAENTNIPEEMIFVEPDLATENSLAADEAINNPEEARTSADLHSIHDHSEDVGCELDDELDKKPNNYNNHQTFDPYTYYERTVDELSELNKKLALTGKSIILTPSKIGHVDEKPATPEVLPQVSYTTSEENHNDGAYSGSENVDDVGSVHSESMGPSTALEGKSANPNPDAHLHSHSYSHTHSHVHSHQKTFGKGKTFHSVPIVTPTVYGTSSPAVVYPQSPGFSSKAEAHAKAETYNRGDIAHSYSNANSKSISHGQAQVGGVGDLNQNFQTDSAPGINHDFNTGYGQSTIHANAAAGHSQDYSSGFGHTVPVINNGNTGGFGQSQTGTIQYIDSIQSNPQSFNAGRPGIQTAAGSQAISQSFAAGGFPQPSAHANAQAVFSQTASQSSSQATSHNFATGGFLQPSAHAIAQAASQNFASGGFRQPSGQAIAEATSQNFNSGGTQKAFAQATSQSSSGTHRGPQFFQVLGPSSFINTRSDSAVVGSPRGNEGFVMPHMHNIPVSDLLHEMETEANSFPGSENPKSNIPESSLSAEILETGRLGNANAENLSISNQNISVQSDPVITGLINNNSRRKRDTNNVNIERENDTGEKQQQRPDNLLRTSDETEEQTGNDEAGSVLQQNTENTDTTSSIAENVLGATVIANLDSVEVPNGTVGKATETTEISNDVDRELIEMVSPDNPATDELSSIATNPTRPSSVTKEIEKILINSKMNTTQDSNSDTLIGAQEGTMQEANEHKETTESSGGHLQSLLEASSREPINESTTDIMKDAHDAVDIPSEFTTDQNLQPSTDSNDVTVGSPVEAATIIGELSETSSESILGISRNSKHNNNVASKNGIVRDDSHSNEDSSEENKHNSTDDTTNTTQTGKNLTSLTLDEIEDIQFRIPDNSTVLPENNTTNKALENTDNKNSLANDTKHESNQVENKVVDSPPDFSFPFRGNGSKIVFDPSGAPFDSIEAEMSVLTDEEKETFIKQEMELISEVIEETLKNDQFWGRGLKEHDKTEGSENEPSKNDTVVSSPNLFQDFQRSNHEDYERSARSATPFQQDFDSILGAHKEKIENIQKEATDDDDLLMISFIGNSVIKDLENRRSQVEHNMIAEEDVKLSETSSANRERRGVPVTRLISDPTTKVDVPKTLDNVEAVVWHTFENPRAPMYHVRKMLGNAKNVIMSAAKVPPNNVLVPSQYEVAKMTGKNGDERLGAINQKMLSTRGRFENVKEQPELAPESSFGITDTLQKIGGVVRESVKTGKDVVVHANDAATDARNVLYSVKHAAPRLIVPGQVPVIASRTADFDVSPLGRKAMVITPKLLDVQENVVGAEEDRDKQFVGMGNILGAVGLTKPNPPEVEMEKIVLEPSAVDVMKQWDMPKELRSSSAVKTWIRDNLKSGKYLQNKDTLGAAQNNFQGISEPERSTGTKTLKDFFNKMHQEMKEILTSQHEERKKKRKQITKKPKAKPNYVNIKKDLKVSKKKPVRKTVVPIENPVQKIDGILGIPKTQIKSNMATERNHPSLPPDVLDIFADNKFYEPNQGRSDSKTVNSEMNYVDKNRNTDTNQNSPQSIYNADNETVSLFLMPELLKPFMGQPSEDVLHNYMRENGDEISSEERASSSGNTTIYSVNPLNKNITIPLSERGQSLFNPSALMPNADVPEETANPRNGEWSRTTSDKTSDVSGMNFLAKPKSAVAYTDTYKTKNQQNPEALMHNIKASEESTEHFQGNELQMGTDLVRDVNHGEDLGHVLGAINPMMFERYFNESLTFTHSKAESITDNPVLGDINPTRLPQDTDDNKLKENILHEDSVKNLDINKKQHISSKKSEGEQQMSQTVDVDNSNVTSRTNMKIINTYQKPFMGYISHKKIRNFLNEYNNNLAGSSEEAHHQKENTDPVKNIIFTDDYDFDPYM